MPVLDIFSQGEEVITGEVVDTNAAWLAQQGVDLGFIIGRHLAIGDRLPDLVDALKEIAQRADCCLCTGGLGPTTDDLTAEAVSAAFGLPLEFDEVAYGQIQAFFASRSRPMAECNRKQAMLPHGVVRLENRQGTAPGFAVKGGQCWFVFMPGVPSEMKAMFADWVRPMLMARFEFQPPLLVMINTLGIGESDLQERLQPITRPAAVQLGFRARPGEVQVKLLFPWNYSKNEAEKLTTTVVNQIGDPVYSVLSEKSPALSLPELIDRLMTEQNQYLSLLETISHGLVSAKFAGISWMRHAHIETSPSRAWSELENTQARLESIKAFSEKIKTENQSSLVLIQLSNMKINEALSSDGPIPVWTGLMAGHDFYCRESRLSGNKTRKQAQAALIMLDLLRRYLQKMPVE